MKIKSVNIPTRKQFLSAKWHNIAKDLHYTLVNPETCPFLNRLREILEGINLNATLNILEGQ